MKVTIEKLFKFAAISAIISGSLFIIVQLVHPENHPSSVNTTAWSIAHILSFIFPIFGMFGITGIYLNQLEKSGWLGLIGYFLLFNAFVLMICFGFFEAFVEPAVISEAPNFVNEVFKILTENGKGPGAFGVVYQLNGLFYLLGGVIFGIATYRAKVLSKLASIVLILGILLSFTAIVAPIGGKISAVIFSLGLIGLGVSLYRVVSNKNI